MTEKANLIPGTKICQNCRVACQTDVKQAETKSNDDNSEFADERHFEYEHWHTRIFAIKARDWKGQGLLWKKKIGSTVYSGKRFCSVLKIEDDSQKDNVAVTSAKTEEKAKLLTLVPDR